MTASIHVGYSLMDPEKFRGNGNLTLRSLSMFLRLLFAVLASGSGSGLGGGGGFLSGLGDEERDGTGVMDLGRAGGVGLFSALISGC